MVVILEFVVDITLNWLIFYQNISPNGDMMREGSKKIKGPFSRPCPIPQNDIEHKLLYLFRYIYNSLVPLEYTSTACEKKNFYWRLN